MQNDSCYYVSNSHDGRAKTSVMQMPKCFFFLGINLQDGVFQGDHAKIYDSLSSNRTYECPISTFSFSKNMTGVLQVIGDDIVRDLLKPSLFFGSFFLARAEAGVQENSHPSQNAQDLT
jgi:hypothetical protein